MMEAGGSLKSNTWGVQTAVMGHKVSLIFPVVAVSWLGVRLPPSWCLSRVSLVGVSLVLHKLTVSSTICLFCLKKNPEIPLVFSLNIGLVDPEIWSSCVGPPSTACNGSSLKKCYIVHGQFYYSYPPLLLVCCAFVYLYSYRSSQAVAQPHVVDPMRLGVLGVVFFRKPFSLLVYLYHCFPMD